jgi:protein transport protein SEC24
MMVVSDLEDMFCPLIHGYLVNPAEARTSIDALLDMLPEMMENNPSGNRVAAGSALKGALAGLVSALGTPEILC